MNNSVMIENMIKWAEEKIGNSQYAGWCLSFIEDALEIFYCRRTSKVYRMGSAYACFVAEL